MPYIIERKDGTFSELEEEPTKANGHLGDDAVRWQETDRLSDPMGTEVRDWAGRRWVPVPERVAERINLDHEDQYGSSAVGMAHVMKAVEARLILSGVPVPGGIVDLEANATGQDIHALAQVIVARSSEAAEAEALRIKRRRIARAAR